MFEEKVPSSCEDCDYPEEHTSFCEELAKKLLNSITDGSTKERKANDKSFRKALALEAIHLVRD